MRRYLLDTNALIHAARGKGGVRQQMQAHSPEELATSVVSLAELMYGALRSQDPQKTRAAWLEMLAPLELVEFTEACAHEHARIRHDLRHQPIGERDLLIAALATAHGFCLVTHNQGEFSRVPGLTWIDWF